MGPVGSSKSSACWMELLDRAMRQEPDPRGLRRTRAAILRNTYPELKSTTIKTVLEWCPKLQMKWDSPITGSLDIWLPDKTRVQLEVIFLALERPEEVDKIGSLEITFGWVNEVREVAKAVFDKLTERVGRFPKLIRDENDVLIHGPTWRGVVMDTNPPDDDHWYHKIAEKSDPELVLQTEEAERKLRELKFLKEGEPLIEFFKQPGGLILTQDGKYEPNPAAENIKHLDGGYAYYYRQLAGKSKGWIKSQILGQYATVSTGKPVYAEYNDDTHCREVTPNPKLPLVLGWDFGLEGNAVVFGQLTKLGQLVVLDELCTTRVGLDEFAETVVKPHLAMRYPKYEIRNVGDPSGAYGSTNTAETAFRILGKCGFVLMPALSNDPMARIEAVRTFMNRMTTGQPGFLIDPRAAVTRKALSGRYCFERVQVSNKEIYKDKPAKDEYSHPADALGYLAMHVSHVELGAWSKKDKIAYPSLGVV
jgi:hypothetical protein